MCGIAGVVEAEGPATRELLDRMGAAIAHRGPDEGRSVLLGRAGFAFRRLAIIDVAGGSQPIENETGRITGMCNGEIYNYLDLRRELEARGHRFRTQSDVETVVHGYEEWGDDVASHLHGMFVFAVWDADRERLLLGRDRLGKKPLVYAETSGRLIYGSEFAAVLADLVAVAEALIAGLEHAGRGLARDRGVRRRARLAARRAVVRVGLGVDLAAVRVGLVAVREAGVA